MKVKQLKVRKVEKNINFEFSLLLSPPPSSIAGEIILDDLSFDILEALKNVDEDKKQEDSSNKRKTRNSFTNRTREAVVDDDDSDEEYSPPKVRFWNETEKFKSFSEIKAGGAVDDVDAQLAQVHQDHVHAKFW